MNAITWITENSTELIAIVGGIVTVASLIVKLTPTPKDDAILAKVYAILKALALTPKDK